MTEARIPVATLKARLSEYLRRARAGEAVVVTDRGIPVARLGPLEGALAREGRVEELASRDRPRDPEGRSLEAVLDERAEGW